jgi:hypothetical protein|tara:strand:+ start:1909 stop:2973 length:1065 start_codon:yes stop_codon:yes gene_type:complete
MIGYSKEHFGLLIIMLTPFFLPFLLSSLAKTDVRVFSSLSARSSVKNIVVLLIILYSGFSTHYYYTRQHEFDPFLQIPAPDIRSEYGEHESFRVLVLGGSTSVDYPSHLWTKLVEAYPEVQIEIIVGARMWWTTKHSLIAYVSDYERYEPDLVIIMHGINDLVRSCHASSYAVGEYEEDYSHFYGPSINGAKPPVFLRHLFGGYWAALRDNWYSTFRYIEEDYPVTYFKSINPFEMNLSRLVRYVGRDGDGVNVMLVTQPTLYKKYMSREEAAITIFPMTSCVDRSDFFGIVYPSSGAMQEAMQVFNGVVQLLADQTGVYLVDAASVVEKSRENFVDDVHYTSVGHKKIAERIF